MGMMKECSQGDKGCPTVDPLTRSYILDIIDRSLDRLRVEEPDWEAVWDYDDFNKSPYTCDAIWGTYYDTKFTDEALREDVMNHLTRMISDGGIAPFSMSHFKEFEGGPLRQQARALWLTWFRLMIEEGIV